MAVFKDFVNTVAGATFKVSGKNIHQTERNALKIETKDALFALLESAGVKVHQTMDGIVMELPTERPVKTVFIALDPVIKNLEFDIAEEVAHYEDVMAKRVEREAERLAKQAERLAKDSK